MTPTERALLIAVASAVKAHDSGGNPYGVSDLLQTWTNEQPSKPAERSEFYFDKAILAVGCFLIGMLFGVMLIDILGVKP